MRTYYIVGIAKRKNAKKRIVEKIICNSTGALYRRVEWWKNKNDKYVYEVYTEDWKQIM